MKSIRTRLEALEHHHPERSSPPLAVFECGTAEALAAAKAAPTPASWRHGDRSCKVIIDLYSCTVGKEAQ